MKNYKEAKNYLDDLNKFGWKPGLERISRLLELLGNPQKDFKSIHIGGTNGKGSVTVTLARMLFEQGYKVGQFISPEMFDVRERIQVDNEWISEEALVRHLEDIRLKIEVMEAEGNEKPTNFEVWTTLGFLYFKEMQVDFAVIEVGLGGEIDSTNVIDPLLSVITNVSIDHKDYLGDTKVEIAKVKSGIIKTGRPVITGSTDVEVLSVLEAKAQKTNSDLYRFGFEFEGFEKGFSEKASNFIFQNKKYEVEVLFSLVGHHQVVNGSVALEAVSLLQDSGYEIDFMKAVDSMKRVFWPGRLELLDFKGRRILLDAAHNLEGARNLSLALKDIYKYRHLVLIIGILADKERREMVDCLGSFGDKVIITRPNNARADDYGKVAEYFKKYTADVQIIEDVNTALEKGISLTGKDDILCITGSIYMLQDIRRCLD